VKNYLIGILFLFVSCSGQKKASAENAGNSSQQSSPLILLLQDQYGGFEVEETMVIKDQKRLRSLYSKINQTRKPGLPVPVIDFTEEMIIVQCSGEQNATGLPTLSFSKETSTQIILNSDLVNTAGDTSSIVMSYPFCVYKMPLTEKEILVE